MSKKNKPSKKSKKYPASEKLLLAYPDLPSREAMIAAGQAATCDHDCPDGIGGLHARSDEELIALGILTFMEQIAYVAADRLRDYSDLVGINLIMDEIDPNLPLPTEVVADLVLINKFMAVGRVMAECIHSDLNEMIPVLHIYIAHVMVYIRKTVENSDGLDDLEAMLSNVSRDFA